MRFSVAAVLAFAASALAQTKDFDPIYTPNKDETINAGSPFTITWDAPAKYADGTISIQLIGGATQNTQQPIANIASGIKNSAKTYTWTVDPALGTEKVYGLVFKLESDPTIFQYSNPFHIKASEKKPSSSSSASSSNTLTLTKTVTLSTTSTPYSTTAAPTTSCTANATSSASSTTTPSYYNTTVNCTTLAKSTSAGTTSASGTANSTTPAVPTVTAAASALHAGSITFLGVVAALLAL